MAPKITSIDPDLASDLMRRAIRAYHHRLGAAARAWCAEELSGIEVHGGARHVALRDGEGRTFAVYRVRSRSGGYRLEWLDSWAGGDAPAAMVEEVRRAARARKDNLAWLEEVRQADPAHHRLLLDVFRDFNELGADERAELLRALAAGEYLATHRPQVAHAVGGAA